MPSESKRKSKPGYVFEITIKIITIICIMAVEYSLFVKFFELDEVTMPLITAIVIFGILLFLAPRQILGIKFKDPLNELKDKTNKLTDNIKDLAAITNQLNNNVKNLVMASMSDEMYTQLKLIADGKIEPIEMNESFKRELEYFDVLGYIKFPDVGLAKLKNGEIFDMKKISEVTDLAQVRE